MASATSSLFNGRTVPFVGAGVGSDTPSAATELCDKEQLNILSFLDRASIGEVRKMSKSALIKACDPSLGIPVSALQDLGTLRRVIATFKCTIPPPGTKARLECLFPNPTYKLVVEQALGPDRITEAGFAKPADDTALCASAVDSSGGIAADHTKQEDNSYWSQQLPFPFMRTVTQTTKGTPYLTRDNDYSESMSLVFSDIPSLPRRPDDLVAYVCLNIDVGPGNTLGFLSSINDWQIPFRFHAMPMPTGGMCWVGFIPAIPSSTDGRFRFAKISNEGKVTLEAQDRMITFRRGALENISLDTITFPEE